MLLSYLNSRIFKFYHIQFLSYSILIIYIKVLTYLDIDDIRYFDFKILMIFGLL